KSALHGLSRGIISVAQGGTFKSGFASGFSSSFFSPGTSLGGDGAGGFTLRTTIAGVVGGTASEIGGGKFSNGAVSGAFVHMFNAEVTKVVNEFRRSPKWKYAERLKEGANAVSIKAKHLRVELKTFGGGLDTYKALITKTWDYPALSGETIIKFYGSQRDTVIYEIQMENEITTTWHVSIPRLSDDMSSKFIGGVGRMRYGDVYAY
ncbi:MAG: hypothetical protein FAF03_11825, partial [Epsilonproteobacteria bacterium]|nr:hypothetical protein [Campylobacterota bacterium]